MSAENPGSFKAAFDLEGVAVAITEAKKEGRLSPTIVRFDRWEEVEEDGLTWVQIYSDINKDPKKDPEIRTMTMWAELCNYDVLRQLVPGDFLINLADNTMVRPDIISGRKEVVVASVIAIRPVRVIYEFPGLSLFKYQK